jgi:hypothetical protein
MSQTRFDDLTRSLAEGASRRGVLKGLVGGLLAAVAVAFGFGSSEGTEASVPAVCRPACGPCMQCVHTPSGHRCVSVCTACQICRQVPGSTAYQCVPKCDTCSDCDTTGPRQGQCRSRCLRCQRCVAVQNGTATGIDATLAPSGETLPGLCVSRCGPGRECLPGGDGRGSCIAI